jgi:hypothetical protein
VPLLLSRSESRASVEPAWRWQRVTISASTLNQECQHFGTFACGHLVGGAMGVADQVLLLFPLREAHDVGIILVGPLNEHRIGEIMRHASPPSHPLRPMDYRPASSSSALAT